MLGKVTKAAVDRLQPGALLWDTSLVGFSARLQSNAPLLGQMTRGSPCRRQRLSTQSPPRRTSEGIVV
jgi:hypothetical protein